jgi:hypothetical protein
MAQGVTPRAGLAAILTRCANASSRRSHLTQWCYRARPAASTPSWDVRSTTCVELSWMTATETITSVSVRGLAYTLASARRLRTAQRAAQDLRTRPVEKERRQAALRASLKQGVSFQLESARALS